VSNQETKFSWAPTVSQSLLVQHSNRENDTIPGTWGFHDQQRCASQGNAQLEAGFATLRHVGVVFAEIPAPTQKGLRQPPSRELDEVVSIFGTLAPKYGQSL
jgi:hypothetical protein